MTRLALTHTALSLVIALPVIAATPDAVTTETCMSTTVLTADNNMTIKELREACEKLVNTSIEIVKPSTPVANEGHVLNDRIVMEAINRSSRFTLTPHKRNFFLPAVYHRDPNTAPYEKADSKLQDLRKTEAEIQLSVKFLIAENLFGDNGHLYFAYTNYSLWQAYHKEESSPFRGTDHTPEGFITFYNDWEIFGFRNTVNSIGITHQSNGQGGTLSRSWNRILAQSVFEKGNMVIALSPYYRIEEPRREDDNRDIVDYMGHGELRLSYKHNNLIYGLTTRNIFENTDKATFDASVSFPISTNMRGMLRYYNGYGYSLIDYNAKQETIGLGIVFTDLF